MTCCYFIFFFFQAEDGIRDYWRDWSSDVCSSDLDPKSLGDWPGSSQRPSRKTRLRRHSQANPKHWTYALSQVAQDSARSEERRVGKECRSRWWPSQEKKKTRRAREMHE